MKVENVTEYQILFEPGCGLDDFYTEDENEYEQYFQELEDNNELDKISQCVRKDYVWNDENQDYEEDWVEILYDNINEEKELPMFIEYYYATEERAKQRAKELQKLGRTTKIKKSGNEYALYVSYEPISEINEDIEENTKTKLVKSYKETDYGWHNNATTIYGELLDGNYYSYVPDNESLSIYNAPITDKYIDTAYNYQTDDERADDKWFDNFDKEHNITAKYSQDQLFALQDELDNIYFNEENGILDESYKVYTLVGDDGVYNSYEVDTVETEEQAEDRVAELQAETGNSAYYEETSNNNTTLYEIEYAVPDYTGGGIYQYTGKLKDNNYFIADDTNCPFNIRILDVDPDIVHTDDEGIEYTTFEDVDYQEQHLVEDVDIDNAREMTKAILQWIVNNEPEGNYQMEDIENLLNGVNKTINKKETKVVETNTNGRDKSDFKQMLKTFDNNGKYAKRGNWEIGRGGYDLWYEISYNKVPVIGCTSGKVSAYQKGYEDYAKLVADEYNDTYVDTLTEGKVTTMSGTYNTEEYNKICDELKQAYKDAWNGKISYTELEDKKKSSGLSNGELSSIQYIASREDDKKEESSKLTETSDDELEKLEQDLRAREIQALKDIGDPDPDNLMGIAKRLPAEQYSKFEKEQAILDTIRMIHSILIYTDSKLWTEKYVMESKYMQDYINDLGRDTVKDIVNKEIADFKANATIQRGVYTDSEGVSYNSLGWKKKTEAKSLKTLVTKIQNKINKVLQEPEYGFTEKEIKDYTVVETEKLNDEEIKIEVRAELDYEGLDNLMTELNPIIQKYDENSYFDADEPGIASAIINTKINKITEAVDKEEVQDKVEQEKQETGIKDDIDTEDEVKTATKKEVYQYAKQQGLDLDKLRKQGIDLSEVQDVLDKVIGNMVSKSVIEYEDKTNKQVDWDFNVKDNDIEIIITELK